MTFDFYALCAKYWNVGRKDAKLQLISLFVEAGGDMDLILEGIGMWGFNRTAQMQPLVLDRIPNEARVEMLAHYGIVLGDS